MVMEALRRTELRGCKKSSRHAQKALAVIGVGLIHARSNLIHILVLQASGNMQSG